MVLAWCAAGALLAREPRSAALLARRGHQLVPLVLVALGVWILLDAESWRLLAR
jgi:cadmium resistance protein CadD (predicted permease)